MGLEMFQAATMQRACFGELHLKYGGVGGVRTTSIGVRHGKSRTRVRAAHEDWIPNPFLEMEPCTADDIEGLIQSASF